MDALTLLLARYEAEDKAKAEQLAADLAWADAFDALLAEERRTIEVEEVAGIPVTVDR
jgi:hypothetical protein